MLCPAEAQRERECTETPAAHRMSSWLPQIQRPLACWQSFLALALAVQPGARDQLPRAELSPQQLVPPQPRPMEGHSVNACCFLSPATIAGGAPLSLWCSLQPMCLCLLKTPLAAAIISWLRCLAEVLLASVPLRQPVPGLAIGLHLQRAAGIPIPLAVCIWEGAHLFHVQCDTHGVPQQHACHGQHPNAPPALPPLPRRRHACGQ